METILEDLGLEDRPIALPDRINKKKLAKIGIRVDLIDAEINQDDEDDGLTIPDFRKALSK